MQKNPDLQDETTQDPTNNENPFADIPQNIDFPNDQHGVKKELYSILYENVTNDHLGLTLEDIHHTYGQRIAQSSNPERMPPTQPQISTHLVEINRKLISRGLTLISEKKGLRANKRGKVIIYTICKFENEKNEENQEDTTVRKKTIEDTEINKADYIKSVKKSLPHGTYMLALAIAEKPGITAKELKDDFSIERIYQKVEKLNEAGSSSKLPRKFKITTVMEDRVTRYYLTVYKPQINQAEYEETAPTIIPELLTLEIKTVFDIRKALHERIQAILTLAENIEKRGQYSRHDTTILRTKIEASITIASGLQDIIETLNLIASGKPEIARTITITRERLSGILQRHISSNSTEFSKGLRSELRRIC